MTTADPPPLFDPFEPEDLPTPSIDPQPSDGGSSGTPGPALPEDLRVPWGWIDVLLLATLAAVSTAAIGFLIFVALAFVGVSPARIRKSPDLMGVAALVAQILLDLGLLGYLALQVRLRFNLPFWRTIGWRPIKMRPLFQTLRYFLLALGGFLLAAAVAFLEGLFPPKHPLPIETMTQSPHAALLFMATAVLLAPVVEETIFRGYLYPVAARSFGIGPGIVITGTLFGLLHAGQLWGGWWQIALLVVVGVVFTAVRAVMRTVVASYILHAAYNALPVIATLLSSVKHLVPPH